MPLTGAVAKRLGLRSIATKKEKVADFLFFSSGGRTRTSGLRVMSPTSYQLLYPAMFVSAKVRLYFELGKSFCRMGLFRNYCYLCRIVRRDA